MKKWLIIFIILILAFLFLSGLPESNDRKGIDAGALFYTDTDISSEAANYFNNSKR